MSVFGMSSSSGPDFSGPSFSVAAFAPATVANVAAAFDVLGFAVEAPGDTVLACCCDTPGVTIRAIHGDGGALPLDPHKNTASSAVLSLLRELGSSAGIEPSPVVAAPERRGPARLARTSTFQCPKGR